MNTYKKGTFFFNNHSSSWQLFSIPLEPQPHRTPSIMYDISWPLDLFSSTSCHLIYFPLFSCRKFILRISFTQCTLYDVKVSSSFPPKLKKKIKNSKPLICVGTIPRVPVCFPFIPAGRSHLVSENVRNWAECPAQQTVIGRTVNDGKGGWICLHSGNGQITWTKKLSWFMENL